MNPTSILRVFGKSTLGRRFTFITIMFLTVLLGITVYTTTTIQKAKSNAILIDMAGRQRMLFEKHLNEVYLTSQGITADYKSTRELLRSTLASLIKGGSVTLDPETGKSQIIPAVPTEEILLKLREQVNHFDKVIESSNGLLMLSPDFPEFYRVLKTLRAQNSIVIGIADDAVKQLARHSELNIATMVKWEAIIGIFVGLLGVYVTRHGIRESWRLGNEMEERKRAESALRDSELFLNSIVENIPDMIFVKDAKKLQFLRVNKAGEELVGHPQEAMIGKTDYDFFPKSEADFYTTKDREVLSGKTLMDIPNEVIQTKSHGTRYLHTKKIPILDDHGTPQYLLGISEDITEQKQRRILLETMEQAQSQFILGNDPAEMFDHLLQNILSITQSEYGFIGEILFTPEGKPYLKTQAITNIAWNQETQEMYERFAPNLEFFNLNTLFGKVLTTGQPVLANDPMNDPRSGGLPKGHPPMHAFLGLPFYRGDRLVGMVGLANRANGYDAGLISYLQPLLSSCGIIIEAHQNSQQKIQAEKDLRATEQMYRQILDSIPDMVLVKDRNFRILWANKAFRSYYNMTNEELEGILDAPINEADFTKQYNKDDSYVINTGKILDIPEEPVTRHDGQVAIFHTIKAPLFGESGEVVKSVGVSRDITERKQAEALTRKGERKFRAIYEQAPTGIGTMDSLSGQFTEINQKFCAITGYSKEEMLDWTFQDITHPDDLQADLDQMQKLLAGQINSFHMEKRYIRKDGEVIWVNLTCVPLWLEPTDPRLHLGMVEDITHRKHAEKVLQESEERYRTLYEDNPSMYFTVAQDGTILSVNQFGAQQLGYSAEELIGQPVICVFLEDDKPLVQEHFNACLQGSKRLYFWELRKQRKDGSVLWVREAARTIQGENGKPVVLIVCEDITERKQTEERLRQSEAKETDALRQSDALKSALLSSVSHELRTPLTAMKGSISSIIGNGSSNMDQEQQSFLKGVDREINYMSHLVDNLLDMSQIEAGSLIPHKEWHLLEDLVEGALRLTAQTLDTRNIEIDIPEDVPPIFVDALEIQQVLINLLDNAVKYSFPASPIRIHARVDAQQITVEASNMGEPISPRDLERIFDRFYRRPPPRQQPIRGTGLGLAICKGIVEAHGGRIWADSIGKEVTIAFTIPIIEPMPSFSLEGRHKSQLES